MLEASQLQLTPRLIVRCIGNVVANRREAKAALEEADRQSDTLMRWRYARECDQLDRCIVAWRKRLEEMGEVPACR